MWAEGKCIGFDFRFRGSAAVILLENSCTKCRGFIWICFVLSFLEQNPNKLVECRNKKTHLINTRAVVNSLQFFFSAHQQIYENPLV